jgi:valyl-tRNA synthetase
MADHWVLAKLQQNIEAIGKDLDNYHFSEAHNKLYHFIWDDVADWYIEANKIQPNPSLLLYVLESILKLAHPFAPFVTETIWQTLGSTGDELLINQTWPKALNFDKKAAGKFSEIQNIVSEIRYITTALEVKSPSLYYTKEPFLDQNAALIKKFAKLNNVAEVEAGRGMHLTQTKFSCWLDIDLATAQKYVTKLRVNKLESEATIERLKSRLTNKSYTSKAPDAVIQQTKDQLAEEESLHTKLEQELSKFTSSTKEL